MRNEDRATPVVAKRAVRGFCDFTARDAKWFSANDSSLREKRTQKLKRRRATRRIVEAFRRARSFRVRNAECSAAGMKSRFFAVFRPDRRRCRDSSRIRRERWSEAQSKQDPGEMEIGELFVFVLDFGANTNDRPTSVGADDRRGRRSRQTLLYASALPKPEERRRQTGLP